MTVQLQVLQRLWQQAQPVNWLVVECRSGKVVVSALGVALSTTAARNTRGGIGRLTSWNVVLLRHWSLIMVFTVKWAIPSKLSERWLNKSSIGMDVGGDLIVVLSCKEGSLGNPVSAEQNADGWADWGRAQLQPPDRLFMIFLSDKLSWLLFPANKYLYCFFSFLILG